MKLCECTIGILVVKKGEEKKIGHVVGLAYNYEIQTIISCGGNMDTVTIIPVVQFVGDELPTKIHYGNIEKFRAY